MANYINKKDQEEMALLISFFLKESDNGKVSTPKSNRIMNLLYEKFIDKIIQGVIYSPRFKFYNFYDPDDLFQVGRIEIYKSIIKQQWNPLKGSIFNFFTTVLKKNLTWYTMNHSRKKSRMLEVEITEVNDSNLMTYEDFDQAFFLDSVFDEMKRFFKGRDNMHRLCLIFIEYYNFNRGKKFVKKEFIEYANTYAFSSSFCHSFFNNLKKIKNIQKILHSYREK